MTEHLSNQDLRDFENGKILTDDQRRHLKQCFSCRFYLKSAKTRRAERTDVESLSWWRRLVGAISSFFSKKKDA